VNELRKVYIKPGKPDLVAVNGVSFQVHRGECLGLLGPNGAGKSTTMKCVTGFYTPTSGHVDIAGIDVHKDPKRARQTLGICAQDDTLDTDFDVLEQMIQYGAFFGLARREAESRARKLLERFDLLEKADDLVESLSGGMRRRLQVARGLINRPDILVLDEPTTGLDPEARRVLWDIMVEQRGKGLAILLSTHYMEEAERLYDRVAIIHRGVILACAPPAELIKREIHTELVEEEVRPGLKISRKANLEDVYLKLTGASLVASLSDPNAGMGWS
jgi:lipooligosaccharide transport system ATP-binding protein